MNKDWEKIEKYYLAWWNCEVLDKVAIKVEVPPDKSQLESLDTGSVADRFNKGKVIKYNEEIIHRFFCGGFAFFKYWPNFGPDVFSGYMGATLEFSPLGSYPVSWVDWNKPILKDYSDLSALEIKEDNFYWQKTKEFTSYALERAQGHYLVGITDLHAGMDSLAVLRGGPEKVCMDLFDNPDGVKKAMKLLWKAWHKVHEESCKIIAKKQRGTCSWMGGIWSPGKMYAVQNDFTCLISTKMYEEFFLEEILNEINYLDHSVYHLDGPDALKHLDMLLEIPRLNAIQWVPGAGLVKEGVAKWMPIYKKIQSKKKAVIVYCKPNEINFVLDNLSSKGLMISTVCSSQQEAEELLQHYGWN